LYCLTMHVFSFLGLIQSIKFGRKAAVKVSKPAVVEPKDLLDS
jgi:hypothetical protein